MTMIDFVDPIQLAPHTWALGGPFAWVYYVRGTRSVLIDTGMSFMTEGLLSQLQKVPGGDSLWGLLHTHSHFDHLGCTSAIRKALPVEYVAGHAYMQKVIGSAGAAMTISGLNNQVAQAFGSDALFEMPSHLDPIAQGDCIDLGQGVQVRVWETPGHTRDSISFEVVPDKVVVTGEAIGVPITSMQDIQVEFLTSYDDYRQGIETVQQLSPNVLGLPHNTFSSSKDESTLYLQDSLKLTDQYWHRLGQYLHEANGDFQAVFDRIFREDYHGGSIGQPEPAYRLNLEAQVRLAVKVLG